MRDLLSTLGTIVNGEPIGDHFRGDEAPLRTGENEVIAGGVKSPFLDVGYGPIRRSGRDGGKAIDN